MKNVFIVGIKARGSIDSCIREKIRSNGRMNGTAK